MSIEFDLDYYAAKISIIGTFLIHTSNSISPCIITFIIINKRLIDYFVAAGCREIAGEIPIAGMIRAGFMQVFYSLEDDLHI